MNAMMIRAMTVFALALAFSVSGMMPATGWAQAAGWSAAKWPEQGEVAYQVALGFGGLSVGQARHTWSHDGKQYRMRLAVETVGVAAALRKLGYVQQSEGDVGENGLRPRRFDVTQLGKTPEMALFDWDKSRVGIYRGTRERRSASLTAGDQDILSVWHQIGHADKLPEALLAVGNKDARRARITHLEDGDTQVPAGSFATRHFRIHSEDGQIAIDLWLALDRYMVPVRAVLDDTKSVTLILEATSISPEK
ncbi:MAG: DUF3108 domain-containing protein [Azoarcus sp.]|jgi:hypothetical protein|nr:DUF3108 domain-containing protein [Azoarcus sp.]